LRVVSQETNEMAPPDTVLALSPPAGRKLREGATVSVRISSGSRMVSVPDLRKRTVDTARTMLKENNLFLDDQIESVPDSSIEAGLIVSQDPQAPQKIERGGKVHVKISAGSSGRATPDEGQEKQYLYELKIKLAGIESSVMLKVEIVDTHGTRTVYEQMHDADETVQVQAQGYGQEATFKIYYDDQLVKEIKKKAEGEAPTNGEPAP